jgi:hypothetical protein
MEEKASPLPLASLALEEPDVRRFSRERPNLSRKERIS